MVPWSNMQQHLQNKVKNLKSTPNKRVTNDQRPTNQQVVNNDVELDLYDVEMLGTNQRVICECLRNKPQRGGY